MHHSHYKEVLIAHHHPSESQFTLAHHDPFEDEFFMAVEELPAVKDIIEIPSELPVVPEETSGGFPWCGAGIVVVVVAAAILGRKYFRKS